MSEPWLRGGINDLDPVRAALVYSFRHCREDAERWLSQLPEPDIDKDIGAIASPGFQVRHIAGSVDRMMTYVAGRQISDEQIATLKAERQPQNPTLGSCLQLLDTTFARAEAALRSLDPSQYTEPREIGRQRIVVPLGVLLVHISEHTQRHTGQLVLTVKVALGDHQ